MIIGHWHHGSGMGDQLFRYITTRSLAEKKGYEWAMTGEFKGRDFMPLENHDIRVASPTRWNEKDVRDEFGNDTRSYDPEINFVEDNTIIDGSFEDDKYWRHNLENISKWLAVEPLKVPVTKFVVGFRGGEYATQPDLFLGQDYYQEALGKLWNYEFEVHTDDPTLARSFFHPDISIVDNIQLSHSRHSNMGFNWRSMRYAQHAVIPNSAFFILPRLLKHLEDPKAVTIAPRYWARHNTKVWARPSCYYPEFTYV